MKAIIVYETVCTVKNAMVNKTKAKQNKNNVISMVRGISSRYDVEMSKKKIHGGHLGFLAAIFDLQWVLDKPVLYTG